MTAAPTARNAKNARINDSSFGHWVPLPERCSAPPPTAQVVGACPRRRGEVQVTADPLGHHHAPAPGAASQPLIPTDRSACDPGGGTGTARWPAAQAEAGRGRAPVFDARHGGPTQQNVTPRHVYSQVSPRSRPPAPCRPGARAPGRSASASTVKRPAAAGHRPQVDGVAQHLRRRHQRDDLDLAVADRARALDAPALGVEVAHDVALVRLGRDARRAR